MVHSDTTPVHIWESACNMQQQHVNKPQEPLQAWEYQAWPDTQQYTNCRQDGQTVAAVSSKTAGAANSSSSSHT